jgi:hypothetical protein
MVASVVGSLGSRLRLRGQPWPPVGPGGISVGLREGFLGSTGSPVARKRDGERAGEKPGADRGMLPRARRAVSDPRSGQDANLSVSRPA